MKNLFIFLLSVLGYCGARAQTTLYTQTFNTGSTSEWSLNTTDEGGVVTGTGNQWMINNIYAAGPLGTATPTQPSGITGGPTSHYMHMNCGPLFAAWYGSNCNFNSTGSGDTYFTALNTPIVTTGYTGVTLTFWWICNGSSSAAGRVFYRTSTSGPWTLITTPITTYYGSSVWTMQTITLAAFDNKAALEFGFQFRDGTGSDPAFGIDEIKVTGMSTSSTPTAAFTASKDTVCKDSCITFTNTTTGSVDSIRWTFAGASSIASTTVNPLTHCFSVAGTYTVTLTAHGGGGSSSIGKVIVVKPSPKPNVTKTGTALSVSGSYTSYQWYNGTTAITGATNSGYIYTTAGSYSVMVDSGGCFGKSIILNTAGVYTAVNEANEFRVSRYNSDVIYLHAANLLRDRLFVNIYDMTGRRIVSEVWQSGSDLMPLSVATFVPGMYIIKLSNENTTGVVKWQRE
jgi:PKD repeat protein